MYTMVAVQWNIICAMGQVYFMGVYANNVECVNTSVPGHIVDCIEFL